MSRDGWVSESLDMELSFTPFLAKATDDKKTSEDLKKVVTEKKVKNITKKHESREGKITLNMIIFIFMTPLMFIFFQSMDPDIEEVSFGWFFWLFYIGGIIQFVMALRREGKRADNELAENSSSSEPH